MYNGKHTHTKRNAPKRRVHLYFRKSFVALCAVLTLLIGVAGGTLAYLSTNTEPVENVFTPASVPIKVEENFDGNTKENVSFTNTGNVDAYIRAAVVVYWTDGAGNIVEKPDGYNYTITYSQNTGWVEADGYHYYTQRVSASGSTGILIEKASWTAPENPEYKLVVDVLAQSIQADGKNANGVSAVTEAWGVSVNADGTLAVQ